MNGGGKRRVKRFRLWFDQFSSRVREATLTNGNNGLPFALSLSNHERKILLKRLANQDNKSMLKFIGKLCGSVLLCGFIAAFGFYPAVFIRTR